MAIFLTRGEAAHADGDQPLRALAEQRGLLVGVAVATDPFSDFIASGQPSVFSQTLASQFNILTAENAMKFGNLSPRPHEHDWSTADAMFDFAQQHDMKVRFHTGLWHRQNPDWVTPDRFTPAQLRDIARWHIEAIGDRYNGRMLYWDVVNEPIDAGQPDHLRETMWKQAIGPDYLAMVYRWAHAAAPDARLVINDYSILGGGKKANALYAVVSDLLERDVPVHAVGFQTHLLDGEAPEAAAIVKNLQRFADLGLEVQITEMDVATTPFGDAPDALERQARMYEQVLEAALRVPQFRVFQTWGLSDHNTWVVRLKSNEHEAPLLFDRSWRPKPAFDAVRRVIEAAAPRPSARETSATDPGQSP